MVHDRSLGPGKTLTGPNYSILPGGGGESAGTCFKLFEVQPYRRRARISTDRINARTCSRR